MCPYICVSGPSWVCQVLSWVLGTSRDPQGAPCLRDSDSDSPHTVWPVVQREQGGEAPTQPGPSGAFQKFHQAEACRAGGG